MTRVHGITLNGTTTDGRCHYCGNAVTVQHGSYPGENYPHSLFWCDVCNRYGLTYPLNSHGSDVATGETVYLIRVGGDCHFGSLTTSHTVTEIQAAMARVKPVRETAVQMRLL